MYIQLGGVVPTPSQARSLAVLAFLAKLSQAEKTRTRHAWNNSIFEKTFLKAKNNFYYVKDPQGQDNWFTKSYKWVRGIFTGWRMVRKGDCDDFTGYMMECLERANIPLGAMTILVHEAGPVRHMVLGVDTSSGSLVFDFNAGSPIRYQFKMAEWVYALSAGDANWHEITGEDNGNPA